MEKRNVPKIVYLQWLDEFGEPNQEVTWADEKIHDTDIVFIRRDLAIFYEGQDVEC